MFRMYKYLHPEPNHFCVMNKKLLLFLSFCCVADILCHAGTFRHDNVSVASDSEAGEPHCMRVIPTGLLPENEDIDLDAFMASLSEAMRSADGQLLAPEASEDKVVSVISEEFGQLERILQESGADTATELIVSGPIDESDFKALWRCATKGNLRALDLGNARIKDNTVPDRAFYQYGPSDEGLRLRITKIVLPDDVVRIGKAAFPVMRLREINIPSSLREIGSYAFAYDYWLDCPIVIPEGVSEIGDQTFISCIRLGTPVTLPSTLRKIGSFAFAYTYSMPGIELNEGLQHIGEYAFLGAGLEEVTIPESIVGIDNGAFSGNNRLERISLPETMEAVPADLFSNCSALEKVSIPDRVKVIEESAFYGCVSLSEVSLPESLEAVERDAFNCCDMETVVLPRNLRSLGLSCLCGNNLRTVFCEAEVPPVCDSNPFSSTTILEAVLYVPLGCGESYRNAWVWNQYNEIKETDSFPSAVTSIVMYSDKDDGCLYDLSGRRVANPLPNRIYIKNGKKILTY